MATPSNKIEIQIGDEVTILKGDELIAFNDMRAELQAEYEARKAEVETKAIAKAAILDRIGLTADELKTILG